MRIFTLSLLLLCLHFSFGQNQSPEYQNELISLAKIYKSFHGQANPTERTFDQLKSITSPELNTSVILLRELIKNNNNLASKPYLTKPDSVTLKSLYIIRGVNYNLFEAEPAKSNEEMADSLMKANTHYHELISCYYGMIFSAIGNKNRPFDMGAIDFTLDEYNLANDTEKGIFFLESMETFGSLIWGYMNVPKPPNFKETLRYIDNYPTYNEQPYYQYQALNFTDFKLRIDKTKPLESFKKHYINKYLNTLLYHAVCLSQKRKDRDKKMDVLMTSIIRNESYWQYSENPEIFKQIFQKQ